jgi:hypothetical protein
VRMHNEFSTLVKHVPPSCPPPLPEGVTSGMHFVNELLHADNECDWVTVQHSHAVLSALLSYNLIIFMCR